MTKKILDIDLQNKLKISCNHEVMPNGETRARMSFPDGSAYILTSREHCETGAWQNSHYHGKVYETYIVQEKWVALARLINGNHLNLEVFGIGESFTVKPWVHHNVYLPAGAITHTVKYGESVGKDWHESRELDALTKHLSEEDIVSIALTP